MAPYVLTATDYERAARALRKSAAVHRMDAQHATHPPQRRAFKGAHESVRCGDNRKLAQVAREAHAYLNGRKWNEDTAGNIAACFERAGFDVAAAEPEGDEG